MIDFDELYVDEQLGSEHDQAFLTHAENRLKEVHTCLPGIVQSFDASKGTATVQPAIQRIFTADGAKNLPLLFDVLVCFPGGGGWSATFPVAKNDECVLIFSERAIDLWYKDGGIQQPSVFRLHDLSDAFALVGVRSQPRKLSDIATDGMELRNDAGTVSIKLSATGIAIKGNVTVTGNIVATGTITP